MARIVDYGGQSLPSCIGEFVMKKFVLVAVATLGVLGTAVAEAAFLQNSTGLSGSFATQTFDANAGNDTLAASQFAGLTFSSGVYVTYSYNGAYPNMSGASLANFASWGNCCSDPTSFTFSSVMSDVAFAFVSNPQTTTFSAYLGGTLVESRSVSTGYGGTFYGFTGTALDRIVITSSGANDAYLLDRLQTRAGTPVSVPEPGTLALLGLGMLGVGLTRRRRPD